MKPLAAGSVVVFLLDGQRYGLLLSTVERVLRMVYITPLPASPAVVPGVINYLGNVVPVINLRRRFRLADRQYELTDNLILANSGRRKLALCVDGVDGVTDSRPGDWAESTDLPAGAGYLGGMLKREDGLILIHDLETCLSLDEERTLDAALSQSPGPA